MIRHACQLDRGRGRRRERRHHIRGSRRLYKRVVAITIRGRALEAHNVRLRQLHHHLPAHVVHSVHSYARWHRGHKLLSIAVEGRQRLRVDSGSLLPGDSESIVPVDLLGLGLEFFLCHV